MKLTEGKKQKQSCAMDNTSRIPESFVEYDEDIMSNLDHSIEKNIMEVIKGKDYYAQYSGWSFCGYVWWQNSKWCCEVWTYGNWQKTFICDELNDIMDEVSSEYGDE